VRHRAFDSAEATVITMGDSSFVLGYRPETARWGFQLPDGSVALSYRPADAGKWVHLAATYDAVTGTITLYVDSTKQNSVQAVNGTGDLQVGRGVVVDVDDVSVYSGVMSAQDATRLYSASSHL
jgi:hypothetical protein